MSGAPQYRAVVVPTRNRHQLMFDCVHAVANQVDRIVVVDNASNPPFLC